MPMLTDPFNKSAKHWVSPLKPIWPANRVLLEAGIGQRHMLSNPVYFDPDRAHALMQVLQTQKTKRQSALANYYTAQTRFHDLEDEFWNVGLAFPHFPSFVPNVEEELNRPAWILIDSHVVGPLSAAQVGQIHREYAILESEIQKLHESTALANKYCSDAKARYAEAKAKRDAVRASKLHAIERRQAFIYHPSQFAPERQAYREPRQAYFDSVPSYVRDPYRGYVSAPTSPMRTRQPSSPMRHQFPSGGFPSPQMYSSQRVYGRFPAPEDLLPQHFDRPTPYMDRPPPARRARYNSF